MATHATAPAGEADLTTCDREPIHVPGTIQPHGLLLALSEPDLRVVQASRNAPAMLGLEAEAGGLIGRGVEDLVGPAPGRRVRETAASPSLERSPVHATGIAIERPGGRLWFDAILHRSDGALILELESVAPAMVNSFGRLYPSVRACLTRLEQAQTVPEVCQVAAAEVRRMTGVDRVLIYRFDEGWHGTVIAEDRNDKLPSYLGLRFPASDIPAQARALYRDNRTRLIADAGYTPVPIEPTDNPATGRPLDLSFSALRSVSPVHVEYMRNMGTASSMSVSILRDGGLWGLISCHNHRPLVVPFEVRSVADMLGQVLSLQIVAKEQKEEYEHQIGRKAAQARLLAGMTEGDDFVAGLARNGADLLELARAEGAAILDDGRRTLLGRTPTEAEVDQIADWLEARPRPDVFASESLAREFPEAEAFKDRGCGLLAIAISKIHRGHLFWFRPEVIQTVSWGGDPRKPATPEGDGRLHPRHSFEAWKQTVRLLAAPWRSSEIETAVELRNAIVGIVLRRAEERAQFAAELERSNQELEAFSYSVSHDLRAPFRHIFGYSEMLRDQLEGHLDDDARRYIATIIESAQFAGKLIDNLLAFSRMGRSTIHHTPINMNTLTESVIGEVMIEAAGRRVRWEVGDLPRVEGDLMMMRQAMTNLFSNALKYTRPRDEAAIKVSGEVRGAEAIFTVEDNGIGFDMKYADKLFGVFQRLHRMEEFEGTGIGLANVRRIMNRHGGRAWGEGRVDRGAAFGFALPKLPGPATGPTGPNEAKGT